MPRKRKLQDFKEKGQERTIRREEDQVTVKAKRPIHPFILFRCLEFVCWWLFFLKLKDGILMLIISVSMYRKQHFENLKGQNGNEVSGSKVIWFQVAFNGKDYGNYVWNRSINAKRSLLCNTNHSE